MAEFDIQLETPPAIIEKDSRRADDVRKRVGEIDTSLTLSAFELGDLLAEIKNDDLWREWRFESFKDYTKSAGIEVSGSQIRYMLLISNMAKLLKISKTQLSKAKNSKLKAIFTLDPMKTVVDEATLAEEKMSDIMVSLVNDAPNKSLKEVVEIVKRLKGVDATEDDIAGELTWMNFPVRRDAKQTVLSAIELAQKMAGSTIDIMTKEEKDLSQAAALELVAADYLADPNNVVDEGEAGEFQDEVESGDDDEDRDDFRYNDGDTNG